MHTGCKPEFLRIQLEVKVQVVISDKCSIHIHFEVLFSREVKFECGGVTDATDGPSSSYVVETSCQDTGDPQFTTGLGS